MLRRYRKLRNLRQSDLAKITGIYTTTIAKYELNVLFPSTEYAVRLADALGCSVDDFALISSDYRVIGNKIDHEMMKTKPKSGRVWEYGNRLRNKDAVLFDRKA